MFKFIHAADIHLDSPLRGLDNYEGAPVDAIRGAARRAFRNLVQLAITERVDFVILAGDIYDDNWRDYNTGLFFVNELRKLDQEDIPVVSLSGNHDAASVITKSLTLPKNALPYRFPTDKPSSVKFEQLRVALHGQGFASRAETSNLAANYPPSIAGYFNIGVLHTALDGREQHDTYAPCTLTELLARGYDYWALGHVHQRESLNGSERIRVEFPGNIQGRHVREVGAKGCLVVTVDAKRHATPVFHALDVFRWAVVAVDAANALSMDGALDASVKELGEARTQADGRPLAVRVELSCGNAVYRHIADNIEQFRFDLAGQVGSDIWVEKIRLELVGDEQETDSTVTGDAASELRGVLAELQANPAAGDAIFATADCGKLKKALGPELSKVFTEDRDEIFNLAAAFLSGDGKTGEQP